MNESFVANMRAIIEEMSSHPNQEVEVTIGCDDTCSYRPHNREMERHNRSDSSQRVRDKDIRIIGKLGLGEGVKIEAKSILDLVNTKLKSISDIRTICGDCSAPVS